MGLLERIGRAGGVQLGRMALVRAAREALSSGGGGGHSLASAPSQSALEWGWYYPEDGETSAYTGPAPTAATANLVEVTLGSVTGVQQSADADGLYADLSAIRSTALPAGTYALHVLYHQPSGNDDGGANHLGWVGSSATEFMTACASYRDGVASGSTVRANFDSAGTINLTRAGASGSVTADAWKVVGVLIEVTDASNWRVELYNDGTEETGAAIARTGAAPVVDEIQVLTPGSTNSSLYGVVAGQLWYADEGGTSLDSAHMASVSSFLLGLTA